MIYEQKYNFDLCVNYFIKSSINNCNYYNKIVVSFFLRKQFYYYKRKGHGMS